ncbi:hypothetical protein HPB47_023051 [Ixodes persulcatus]|uniref:Uncharacterized protein n=1 Tax=Ixodes persulcatus TaxID=34615 RepID=A0AC60Q974_IXOPE|nr:hypothetical protein HPB47_023051 [Ixodes persulcatus]
MLDKEPRLSRDANVLQFWAERRERNPKLYALAQAALGVPATQVRGLLRAEGTVWILLLFGTTSVHANNVVRETKLGKVRGNLVRVDSTDVEEYIGIPFAEPPVHGPLRAEGTIWIFSPAWGYMRTVEEYREIPFAEPPIGDLRFKEPVPKTSWAQFSKIHQLFLKHNAAVPSSASVERLFSVAGDVFSRKRGNITDENFYRQLLLKGNDY